VNDPQLASEKTDAVALSALKPHVCTTQTILVVEDEAFVREIIAEILESAGYRVLKARNAAEAKVAFQSCAQGLQLLITDMILPGENGRDLANDLRALNAALKVICISGYSLNLTTQKRFVKDGIFYFPKPFSAESLLRKVGQVLAKDLEDLAM
jgi:DNA-binding NtrC family response regulator